MSLKEINRIYNRLPEIEKEKPIIIINEKIFTWKEAMREMRRKSIIGKRIQRELERMIRHAQGERE